MKNTLGGAWTGAKLLGRAVRHLLSVPGEDPPETFITLDRNGGMTVDVEGLIRSGRMDRQINAARELALIQREEQRKSRSGQTRNWD